MNKFFLHRAVSIETGKPVGGSAGLWQLVRPQPDMFDATVHHYRTMNTEPDPFRREVRVFEDEDDVNWNAIRNYPS